MKVIIERAVLLRALNHANSVVEKRNTIPILSNVMLHAADGQLSLIATDLDIQIEECIAATVETPGSTTVQSSTFFEIVRKMPEGSQVQLVLDGGHVVVTAGRSRFRLPALPIDDFPRITTGELPISFAIPAKTLKQIIDKTRFAISTEETRYYLNGIYLHATDNPQEGPMLKAAATDGHRLARVRVPQPEGAGAMPGVIIPRKCVGEVRKLLDDADGDVELTLSGTKIRFDLGGAVLISKLIDGTFPDYTRVIPTANDKLLKLDAKALSQGVDRVATIASEKTRAVKVSLDRDKVMLSVTSPETGTATEEVMGEYAAAPLEIGFNARYLIDILGQIEGDQVELHLADAAAPTLVREGDDAMAIFVIMPMRC